MRNNFKQYQVTSVFICCALAVSAWIPLAQAAAVRAPARTVASKYIVAKPGEPDEVRARRTHGHNRPLPAAGASAKDDSAATASPMSSAPAAD